MDDTKSPSDAAPAAPPTGALGPPTLAGLLGLAWPIVVQRAAQVVVGFADAVMVAHLGESALAAVTGGATNTFNVLILPMGMCFVVSSFSSQMTGKGDAAGARRFGWYGLLVSALTGLLCLAAIPFVDDALALFPYEATLRDQMALYVAIRLVSGGFAVALEALGNFYGGLGNTRLPMMAQIVVMVTNVGLNWLLIDGNLGFPALGIAGAAWASVVATLLGFVVLFACFTLGVGQAKTSERMVFRLEELMRLFRFGLPSGFNWFFEFAAFSFFLNVVVTGLGTTTFAAMMAVLQLNSISFMPAFGIASAGAVFTGQSIGAGRKDDVPAIVLLTAKTTVTWQGLVGLSYAFVPGLLLAPFVREATSPEFLVVATRMLVMSAAWQVFDAAMNTLSESLRAAGDTAFTLYARLAIAWLLFVPGSLVAVRVLETGADGAMVALIAYLVLLSLVLFVRFRSGAWRKIELVGDAPPMH